MSCAYGWRASCVSPGEALRSRPRGGVTDVVARRELVELVGSGAWFAVFVDAWVARRRAQRWLS